MPSERDRWTEGAHRNTIGHTDGATGAITGGVAGHVVSQPRPGQGAKGFGGDAEGEQRSDPQAGRVSD